MATNQAEKKQGEQYPLCASRKIASHCIERSSSSNGDDQKSGSSWKTVNLCIGEVKQETDEHPRPTVCDNLGMQSVAIDIKQKGGQEELAKYTGLKEVIATKLAEQAQHLGLVKQKTVWYICYSKFESSKKCDTAGFVETLQLWPKLSKLYPLCSMNKYARNCDEFNLDKVDVSVACLAIAEKEQDREPACNEHGLSAYGESMGTKEAQQQFPNAVLQLMLLYGVQDKDALSNYVVCLTKEPSILRTLHRQCRMLKKTGFHKMLYHHEWFGTMLDHYSYPWLGRPAKHGVKPDSKNLRVYPWNEEARYPPCDESIAINCIGHSGPVAMCVLFEGINIDPDYNACNRVRPGFVENSKGIRAVPDQKSDINGHGAEKLELFVAPSADTQYPGISVAFDSLWKQMPNQKKTATKLGFFCEAPKRIAVEFSDVCGSLAELGRVNINLVEYTKKDWATRMGWEFRKYISDEEQKFVQEDCLTEVKFQDCFQSKQDAHSDCTVHAMWNALQEAMAETYVVALWASNPLELDNSADQDKLAERPDISRTYKSGNHDVLKFKDGTYWGLAVTVLRKFLKAAGIELHKGTKWYKGDSLAEVTEYISDTSKSGKTLGYVFCYQSSKQFRHAIGSTLTIIDSNTAETPVETKNDENDEIDEKKDTTSNLNVEKGGKQYVVVQSWAGTKIWATNDAECFARYMRAFPGDWTEQQALYSLEAMSEDNLLGLEPCAKRMSKSRKLSVWKCFKTKVEKKLTTKKKELYRACCQENTELKGLKEKMSQSAQSSSTSIKNTLSRHFKKKKSGNKHVSKTANALALDYGGVYRLGEERSSSVHDARRGASTAYQHHSIGRANSRDDTQHSYVRMDELMAFAALFAVIIVSLNCLCCLVSFVGGNGGFRDNHCSIYCCSQRPIARDSDGQLLEEDEMTEEVEKDLVYDLV